MAFKDFRTRRKLLKDIENLRAENRHLSRLTSADILRLLQTVSRNQHKHKEDD